MSCADFAKSESDRPGALFVPMNASTSGEFGPVPNTSELVFWNGIVESAFNVDSIAPRWIVKQSSFAASTSWPSTEP